MSTDFDPVRYSVITEKNPREIVMLRGSGCKWRRCRFCDYHLDFSKDVLSLADQGFKQISVEPVVAPDEADYAIRREDLPQIFEEYDALAKEMIKREKEGNGFQFFHFMIDLTGGPCVYKRLSGCGSGTEYLAVTPWGDLYPCHQFVGREGYVLGNVYEGLKNMKMGLPKAKSAACIKCSPNW